MVTFKLNKEDPENPLLVFAQGDIWEKCKDQATSFSAKSLKVGKKNKGPKSFKKTGNWTENDLLAALDAHHAHAAEIVSGASLAKQLEANLIQEKQLAGIVESAKASIEAAADQQEVSLSDSIRLVCRIDTNVRSAVRLKQMPKEEISPEQEKDIADAEERMKQLEIALGTINAQIDRILSGRTQMREMKM